MCRACESDALVPQRKIDRTLSDNQVVIVGGGQAGLALSYELTEAGLDHVVANSPKTCTWRAVTYLRPAAELPGRPAALPAPIL